MTFMLSTGSLKFSIKKSSSSCMLPIYPHESCSWTYNGLGTTEETENFSIENPTASLFRLCNVCMFKQRRIYHSDLPSLALLSAGVTWLLNKKIMFRGIQNFSMCHKNSGV